MTIKSYRDLEAWQVAMTFVEHVYELTRLFPREELYGLTSQLRRAAIGIPSNVAEGHRRDLAPIDITSLSAGDLKDLQTIHAKFLAGTLV